jgi:hypothetical protein
MQRGITESLAQEIARNTEVNWSNNKSLRDDEAERQCRKVLRMVRVSRTGLLSSMKARSRSLDHAIQLAMDCDAK